MLVGSLAADPGFRWFLGKFAARRQQCAAKALKRMDSVTDHAYTVGQIDSYDRVLGFLEDETKALRNELKAVK